MAEDDNDRLVDTVHYRGFSIPVYESNFSNHFYTIFEGKRYLIRQSNYSANIKSLIDRLLDFIEQITFDSWLEWFDNGGSHRDIKLVFDGRAIKLFLVEDEKKINWRDLEREAKAAAANYASRAKKRRV